MLRGRRHFLIEWVHKVSHDASENPVFPIGMSFLHNMIGKLLRQAPFDRHEVIFVHSKDSTIVG